MTTPKIDRASRDRFIVEAYRQAKTMQAIADDVGLTRARVQQILAAKGELDVAEIRSARRRLKASSNSTVISEFWDVHGASVYFLAEAGASKQEVIDRFTINYPSIPTKMIRDALDRSRISFAKVTEPQHFRDSVLEDGVWYVVGLASGIAGDPAVALMTLDVEESRQLALALESRGLTAQKSSEILGVIAEARENAASTPTSVTKANYDKLRVDLVSLQSATPNLHPWPADAQTVMKRLGGGFWNDAMTSLGLVPSPRGRSRGALVFVDGDYAEALSRYFSERGRTNGSTSYEDYDAWRRREHREGRTWPAAVSVRGNYGSWSSAVRAVANITPASTRVNSPIPRREPSVSAQMLHAVREDMKRKLLDLAETKVISAKDQKVRAFLQEYAGSFEIDRRNWLRAMIVLDAASVPRRLSSGQGLTRKQKTALGANPPDLEEGLTDMDLDKTLGKEGVSSSGGWLSAAAEAELASITLEMQQRYKILRECRNLMTHHSQEARTRVQESLAEAAQIDESFRFDQSVTEINILRWLSSDSFRRLNLIAVAMPEIWKSMLAAEAIVRSEAQ